MMREEVRGCFDEGSGGACTVSSTPINTLGRPHPQVVLLSLLCWGRPAARAVIKSDERVSEGAVCVCVCEGAEGGNCSDVCWHLHYCIQLHAVTDHHIERRVSEVGVASSPMC